MLNSIKLVQDLLAVFNTALSSTARLEIPSHSWGDAYSCMGIENCFIHKMDSCPMQAATAVHH